MKKIIVFASLLILALTNIISASEGDQLPQSIMEGQTISSQLSSSTSDLSDTLLPAPSGEMVGETNKTQEDLAHEGLASAPQNKGILQYLNIFSIFKADKAVTSPITKKELAPSREPDITSLPSAVHEGTDGKSSQGSPDQLTHQALSSDIQGKNTFGFIKPDDAMMVQTPVNKDNKAYGAAASLSLSRDAEKLSYQGLPRTDPDDISHQALATEIQGKSILNVFASSRAADNQTLSAQQSSITGPAQSDPTAKGKQLLIAQKGSDDLSHQALATAVKDNDRFYFIKTGGAVPIFDKTFRSFLDYGASVSLGAGKKFNENLSLSVSLGMMLLTGDWSVGGDRQSIEIAAEEWAPGIYSDPGQTTIIAEELPEENLGIGYHSEGEAIITSAESLKRIDVHTDLYLFPITLNALYKFHPVGKITPYAGGGLGFCMATRDSDSRALKSKYFNGPEYGIRLNNSQTRNGMLLNFLGGFNIPVYKNMTFIAEANMTYFDLKNFDPILEISVKRPQNPSNLGGNDVSTWSYEDPLRIGVFSQEFVGNFFIGLVMPF